MVIAQDAFLKMPAQEIARLIRELKRPRLGAFVPDGSRRLVLAFSETTPDSEDFYRLSATLPAQYLLESLKVFFSHGLPILLVPILSSSVLKRGHRYSRLTALTGLELLFSSDDWWQFYQEYDVRVRVYGDLSLLANSECEPALAWIETMVARTAVHEFHTLYFAIGEPPTLGEGIAEMGVRFWQENGRFPTLSEQICYYYGEPLPTADFFIMTSKMSGLGALPRFLVNGDTEAYFLPSAGAMGLNAHTWRLILYDMLFARVGLNGKYVQEVMSAEERAALSAVYRDDAQTVIGLGEQIGKVWVAKR